jgi:hypothetical protein
MAAKIAATLQTDQHRQRSLRRAAVWRGSVAVGRNLGKNPVPADKACAKG